MNLYFSTKANSPRTSLVTSQVNPIPSKLRDFMLGESPAANIFIVDGVGDYDECSGGEGNTLKVAIGLPGATPVWSSTEWTSIANGWAGGLNFSTDALKALFTSKGEDPIQLRLELWVENKAGDWLACASQDVKVWNRVVDPSTLS